MNKWTEGARWRAAATAALLFLAGGAMGIVVDRFWLSPPPVEATPLTAEAMTTRLGLSSSEAARVRAVLDSLHAEIRAVLQRSPDSLGTVVQSAHARIEAALPADARSAFRTWMQAHHERMMRRMERSIGGGAVHRGLTGRGLGGH